MTGLAVASGPILITGGGTAGHTNPGIAVAQALVEAGLDRDDVQFVGGARGNEGTLVPAAGFDIELLPGRGIRRSLSPSGMRDNIGAVTALASGLVKAVRIVARRRPKAVLCLGGYAAFAASAAAVALRIPLVVTEQNARASAVNRLFGRWARACALPFPGTDLPKGVVTGNPIRADILAAVAGADRAGARARLEARYRLALGADRFDDLGDRVVVAVWSGSLGAASINRAVRQLVERWRDRSDVVIHHVIGRRDWAEFGPGLCGSADAVAGLAYVTVEYEDAMPDLLVGADLAVCRAGASTVSELAVAGLPAVLVPLPNAPRDHQRANSAELEAAGGAIVVDDGDLSGAALADLLEPLTTDELSRRRMSDAAASVARPGAADQVAELLLVAAGMLDGNDGSRANPTTGGNG